jgi:ankyrin repeat protein
LTTASQENADPAILSLLLATSGRLDILTAINLGRYDEAEAMLLHDPGRIGPDGRDTIALHLAVSKRNLAAIRWLLAHGVDVNAKRLMWDCNHTALHMTAESGAVEIARLLLAAGADPNIRDDKFNSTVLGWAIFFGRAELEELVREKGGSS